MNNDRLDKDKEILDDQELENISGGLEMTFGLPAAKKEGKKASSTVQRGKKKKASDLILREDTVLGQNPRKC